MGSRVKLVENRLILYQTYSTPSFSLNPNKLLDCLLRAL